MKLNKEKFLKTEMGSSLRECITAWDKWIGLLATKNMENLEDYRETSSAAAWCQAQWEVYKMAIQQFYGIEYHFTRTDEYFGLVTDDETDWLFKVERKG